MVKAIAIQQNDTYGLLRSPILANFQNVPKGLKEKKNININFFLFTSLSLISY